MDVNTPSCTRSCNCHKQPHSKIWNRRDFLKSGALGSALMACGGLPAMAGPFTREDFKRLVPEDKKLSPDWLKSLTGRGSRTVYRGEELEKIGMPIGGLCAGQVYLGGDGQLWHWDIFNQHIATGAEHYANPLKPRQPFDQGFALKITSAGKTQQRLLARTHWQDISFAGQYPIGTVEYEDPASPVIVRLEAFSPFIPLNTEDSSLPATVLEFTLHNRGSEQVTAELAGWLENPVCLYSAENNEGTRRNRVTRDKGLLTLSCSAELDLPHRSTTRSDIVFDDFERETYAGWESTGTAFGKGPVAGSDVPEYQGNLGASGKRSVNSHASAPGPTVEDRDRAKGTLTSREFVVERDYIRFLIGGGDHKGKTCIELLVDGNVVRSATGRRDNHMLPASWDVRRWAGKKARLRIVDDESGPWGNIGIDDIRFTDHPGTDNRLLSQQPDYGSMCLCLVDPTGSDTGCAELRASKDFADSALSLAPRKSPKQARSDFGKKLVGSLNRLMTILPGASGKITFLLTWYFPNLSIHPKLPYGRHYGTRFDSARAVAQYARSNLARLTDTTRLWHRTWYESSLPHWFLERTFLNTSILATSTCYRLRTGRFYAWEGVGCCEGTCGHVWQYAHAPARLFPDLERQTRENVDFGLALQPNGAIHFRGEFNDIPAIDAQAGTILRALREHQMCNDNRFLRRNWDQIKRATQWLIAKDANADGVIESNQHNTLDTDWFGPVAWLSGLYLAGLAAASHMARELGDTSFAAQCEDIISKGREKLTAELFNGEYFINKPDPKHLDAINSGTGCHIDQVFGQSWAFQVGLPRVIPENETKTSLRALWKYNFTPDVGPYRAIYKPGRWYAMAGEAGLLMCTFPQSGWDYAQAKGKGPEWAAGYFNECMNGFEYQVAGHMLWEGMLTEGLAITRAVHDRYHASRRNPWNEVECGDHYARSMASYGVFLAACGFHYDGPRGRLAFAPRLSPEQFQSAFTTAEGWGSYSQQFTPAARKVELALKFGRLRLRTLEVQTPGAVDSKSVHAEVSGRSVLVQPISSHGSLSLRFPEEVNLSAGETLTVMM